MKLIGVNTEASPGMWLSRRDGRAHLKLPWRPTIAEGIEGGVSQRTYDLGLKYIDDVVVVREESIRRAVAEVWRHHQMAVEGSAAAVLAAVLEGVLPQDLRRVCLVLTGSNIDRSRLDEIVGWNSPSHDVGNS